MRVFVGIKEKFSTRMDQSSCSEAHGSVFDVDLVLFRLICSGDRAINSSIFQRKNVHNKSVKIFILFLRTMATVWLFNVLRDLSFLMALAFRKDQPKNEML